MFAKAEIEPGEKRFVFDFSKYCKIWFSSNPDVFLGIENQLRFVRMRHNNPEAELFFIYSAKSLSNKAIDALGDFCTQYSITPIAFEDIKNQLTYEMDKTLYAHAQEEILYTIKKEGGNLAAASDITRMLVHVIQQYGVYSDFDVETQLSRLGSDYVSLRTSPVLFSVEMPHIQKDQLALCTNTDFLAFGFDSPDHNNKLSKEAVIAIQNVQAIMIRNYQRPFNWEKISLKHSVTEFAHYPKLAEMLNNFHQQHPENPSVFDFRLFLSSLPDNVSEPIQIVNKEPLKSFLTRLSVINISGPGLGYVFFKDLIPKGSACKPNHVPFQDKKWLPYLKAYEKSSIGFYDAIYDLIDTKNTLNSALNASGNESLTDLSWTESGAFAQRNREEQMLNASIVLQNACRKHLFWKNDPQELLFVNVRAICKEKSLLRALLDNNYSLALRKVSSTLKLPLVKLLLEYKKNQGVDFNINEPSPSTGYTALDFVLKAKLVNKTSKETQQEIVGLLKKVGALSSTEISSNISPSIK